MDFLHGKSIQFTDGDTLSEFMNHGRKSLYTPNEQIKYALPINSIDYYCNVNGKFGYNPIVYSVCPNGEKIAIILTGIIPYFYVRVPKDTTANTCISNVTKTLAMAGITSDKITVIQANGFHEYEPEKRTYLKLEFTMIFTRSKALKELKEYDTAGDDKNHYHRTYCRDSKMNLCTWNNISKYKQANIKTITIRAFYVDINDIAEITDDVLINTLPDMTLVQTWDIETFSHVTGDFPDSKKATDYISTICSSFHWKDSMKSMLNVGITIGLCNNRSNRFTIICSNEKDLIMAYAYLMRIMQPDVVTDFNGGFFDFPYYKQRCIHHKILAQVYDTVNLGKRYSRNSPGSAGYLEEIEKYAWYSGNTKIDAGTTIKTIFMDIPHIVMVDVSIVLRKRHPKAPHALRDFLNQYKLNSKEDMQYVRMNEITRESARLLAIIHSADAGDANCIAVTKSARFRKELKKSKKAVDEVVHYCVIDAFRCQELMLTISAINDARSVSRISNTSMSDAFLFADSMKIRNYVIAFTKSLGFVHTETYPGKYYFGKYSGAYVFSPYKSLVRPKLTVAQHKKHTPEWEPIPHSDVIKMQKLIKLNKRIVNRKLEGDDLTPFKMPANTFEHPRSARLFYEHMAEETHHPAGGLDFSSLYPSCMMAFNLSNEMMINDPAVAATFDSEDLHYFNLPYGDDMIEFWIIKSNTYDGTIPVDESKSTQFGAYPRMLLALFNTRKVKKAEMIRLSLIIEANEKAGVHDNAIIVQHALVNSAQKALKLFMNTIYGTLGAPNSPLYTPGLSLATTNIGQGAIKYAEQLVCKDMGELISDCCRLYYGDTDSIYISVPAKFYAELDRMYFSGEITILEYSTKSVQIGFKQIEIVKQYVNAEFRKKYKSHFLKLAYEELLFPAIFMIKKVYWGVEHKKTINFYPPPTKLFTRGGAVTSRDVTLLLKDIVYETLSICLCIDNVLSVQQIVKKQIDKLYTHDWPMNYFEYKMTYKENKQNVTAITFRNRMIERANPRYPPPEHGVSFPCVKVIYPDTYDDKGHVHHPNVGECLEYPEYASKHKLKMDIEGAFKKKIIGVFARILGVTLSRDLSDGESKSEALKLLTVYRAPYIQKVNQGQVRKAIYKKITSRVKLIEPTNSRLSTMCNEINKQCAYVADGYAKKFVNDMCKTKRDVRDMIDAYKNREYSYSGFATEYYSEVMHVATIQFTKNQSLIDAYLASQHKTLRIAVDSLVNKYTPLESKTAIALMKYSTDNKELIAAGVDNEDLTSGVPEMLDDIYKSIYGATMMKTKTDAVVAQLFARLTPAKYNLKCVVLNA